MNPARWVALGLLGLSALTLGGCGTSETAGPSQARVAETAQVAPPPPQPTTRKPKRPKFKACDANIRVRARTTTCPFAHNVFYGYWLNQQQPGIFADLPGIPAYSPAADRVFSVDCTEATTVRCTGGDGALVMFPAAAVARYTIDNARNYVASADLGGVPEPDVPIDPVAVDPVAPPEGIEAGGGCNPNYAGACLDQPGDYDCREGSGNGPNYTGEVQVVGVDEYGLDRDRDNIGCNGQ
jgi:hypothetical protein